MAPGWKPSPGMKACHDGTPLLPAGLTPEYSAHFASWQGQKCPRLTSAAQPAVFISNKIQVEWAREKTGGVFNSLNRSTLEELRKRLRGAFATILYNRAERALPEADGEADWNQSRGLRWHRLMERQWLLEAGSDVRSIDDAWREHAWGTFNEYQLCMAAQASAFITVQGGPSRVAMLFGKPTVVYHARGSDNYAHLAIAMGNRRISVARSVPQLLAQIDAHLIGSSPNSSRRESESLSPNSSRRESESLWQHGVGSSTWRTAAASRRSPPPRRGRTTNL